MSLQEGTKEDMSICCALLLKFNSRQTLKCLPRRLLKMLHNCCLAYSISSVAEMRDREVDFVGGFTVASLTNGVFIGTRAGFEPLFYECSCLTTTPWHHYTVSEPHNHRQLFGHNQSNIGPTVCYCCSF